MVNAHKKNKLGIHVVTAWKVQSQELWRSQRDLILVVMFVLAVISKGLGITPLSSFNSSKRRSTKTQGFSSVVIRKKPSCLNLH